ncbi:MAG: hypothetical protein Q8P18_29395 [Pseudomonadota bacterium]|nr:hypothetical protein [Pseudomonadota bacterium]
MIALLHALACTPSVPTEPAEAPTELHLHEWTPVADRDARLEPLDAPRLLRRMSLDLRGVLPAAEELDAVEADASLLSSYRDAYLDDPRFEGRLVDVLGERWLTEVDEYLIDWREFPGLYGHSELEYQWERGVGEEPLRLMARIAAEDRPWTEIVTADTTMADEVLALTWPVTWTPGDTGWHEVSYTDGRPAAGVLATNGLWWRYYTTFTNYNRMRVGAIARLLVCVDYLSRPVSFTGAVSLGDSDGIEDALSTNPGCQGCHSALDPVAASLFGFWTPQEYNSTETTTYHPERELIGEALLGVTPAWYGDPLSGLADLGNHVAADPRFARCTAESVAEMYWRRELTVDDFERVETLRRAYVGTGRLKDVIAAATESAVYRAGTQTDGGAEEPTARLLDATLLKSVMADLVGFRWEYRGYDQLGNDTYGYRILGGGVDGAYVTRAQREPGLTWERVIARVAEAVGTQVVANDLHGGAPLLLDLGGPQPDEPAFATQLRALRWRLLAERATDEQIADDASLWYEAGGDAGDIDTAWAAVLQALLRDPAFVSY